jgi:formate dehydrogenase subunit gamma
MRSIATAPRRPTDAMGWDTQRAAAIIESHRHLDGAALPVLRALQDAFGHLPDEAVVQVAEALNLSRAEVHGIVTFYHDFRREPAGRTRVKLCRAEACQAMGADALAAEARRRLGVDWHGTTPDGGVTLEPLFCLGLCSVAPAAQVGDELVARADWPKLEEALRRCGR